MTVPLVAVLVLIDNNPEAIIEQIIQFHVANKPESPNEVKAPACSQQGPFAFNGETSQFPHVVYKPSK